MTRPTTPAGEITAMSAASPSALPLSMVTVRNSGLAPAAMTSAAVVSSSARCAELEQLAQVLRPLRQGAFFLQAAPAGPAAPA